MKFVFTGRKMELTDALKDYAEKKLAKLERFFQNDSEATVICHTERGRYTAEVTVRCAGMYFRAQETKNDIYGCIDEIVDMLERQIRKNKTRLEKRLKGSVTVPAAVEIADEPEEEYEVIRRKRFALKPMAVEEAILQMNLLGHSFYAFKNAEDENRYCVVYKRTDGGYGLIESD